VVVPRVLLLVQLVLVELELLILSASLMLQRPATSAAHTRVADDAPYLHLSPARSEGMRNPRRMAFYSSSPLASRQDSAVVLQHATGRRASRCFVGCWLKFRNVSENVVSENACVETHAPVWTRDTEHNTRILIKTEQNLMPDSPRVAVGTGFAPRRCGQVRRGAGGIAYCACYSLHASVRRRQRRQRRRRPPARALARRFLRPRAPSL
jgi:hypothetical protein